MCLYITDIHTTATNSIHIPLTRLFVKLCFVCNGILVFLAECRTAHLLFNDIFLSGTTSHILCILNRYSKAFSSRTYHFIFGIVECRLTCFLIESAHCTEHLLNAFCICIRVCISLKFHS